MITVSSWLQNSLDILWGGVQWKVMEFSRPLPLCSCWMKFSFLRKFWMHLIYFTPYLPYIIYSIRTTHTLPASILYKSIAGRYRPVSYPDGPITARYRFIKNASYLPVFFFNKHIGFTTCECLRNCTRISDSDQRRFLRRLMRGLH